MDAWRRKSFLLYFQSKTAYIGKSEKPTLFLTKDEDRFNQAPVLTPFWLFKGPEKQVVISPLSFQLKSLSQNLQALNGRH